MYKYVTYFYVILGGKKKMEMKEKMIEIFSEGETEEAEG
jgi:hypothetical protein